MVPEGRGVFARLLVTENLEMGAYSRSDKKEVQDAMEGCLLSFHDSRNAADRWRAYRGRAAMRHLGFPVKYANTDADGRAVDGACRSWSS